MLQYMPMNFLKRKKMSHLGLQEAYRDFRKNKSGYTLIELIVILAIILILSSMGVYAYQGALSSARGTVCKTNLKALGTAITEYVLENDALPATLGRLKLKHLEKGYAKAMEDRGWVTEFSLFLIKLDESDHAYAQYLTYENLKKYGVREKIFHCPADGNRGASYAMNGELEGKKWSEVDQNDIIVADSDNYVFTSLDQLAKRHKHKAFAITKQGKLVELSPDGEADGAADGTADGEADDEADDDKVTICHKGKNTLTISNSALQAHLDQGGTLGPCP
jgi:prepilin-type N-terminal cleavage/methylation domain-containing protein